MAAGHSRMLLLLPAFVPVLALVSAVEATSPHPDVGTVRLWGAAAFVYFAVSFLVTWFRATDRRYLRDLALHLTQPPLRHEPRLRRFAIEVGLFFVEARFSTPFRPIGDPRATADRWIAQVLTGLLGWWSLPGLFRTPQLLFDNARGGEVVQAQALLAALQSETAVQVE